MSRDKITDIRSSSRDLRRASASVDAVRVANVLEDWRDVAISEAGALMRSQGLQKDSFRGLDFAAVPELANALDRARTYGDLAERARSAAVPFGDGIRSEPRTYGPGSSNSFYADHFWRACPGHPSHAPAAQRLERHAREVAVEIRDPTSAEGQRAIRAAGTLGRNGDRPDREVAPSRPEPRAVGRS